MSMVVNMEESNQRNSDTEQAEEQMDKYSNKAPSPDPVVRKPPFPLSSFEGSSALIHTLFLQKDYAGCKSLIGEQLEKHQNMSEFALSTRGTIARIEGKLDEAIEWFQKALTLSAKDPKYYLHIGRCYFLQGKHTQAVEYLEKSIKGNPKDPQAYYWLARAIYHLDTDLFNPTEKARDLLLQAPVLSSSIDLIVFFAKLLEELGDTDSAISAYERALTLEPENLDVIFKMGMVYLRDSKVDPAFAMFGKALTYDPSHSPSIMAAGAIMQAHGDHDVALNKYRVAANQCDYNGCLWNNIGLCLYSKGKLAAAHSCLKKAAYICPLDYRINFNLGLVHHTMGLHCSALHFFKAAAELKKDDSIIIGAMALVLSNMNDITNARRAYKKAMTLSPVPNVVVNYAVFEYKQGDKETSKAIMVHFRKLVEEEKVRPDLIELGNSLSDYLLAPPLPERQPSAESSDTESLTPD